MLSLDPPDLFCCDANSDSSAQKKMLDYSLFKFFIGIKSFSWMRHTVYQNSRWVLLLLICLGTITVSVVLCHTLRSPCNSRVLMSHVLPFFLLASRHSDWWLLLKFASGQSTVNEGKMCWRWRYHFIAESARTHRHTNKQRPQWSPSVRSVKLNKFNSSSQLDGRRNLINLSILGLDHWTEPHRGASVQWQRGEKRATDVCACERGRGRDREREWS